MLRGCAWSFSRLMLERNCEEGGRGYANAGGQRHVGTDKEGRTRSVEAARVCAGVVGSVTWLNCS